MHGCPAHTSARSPRTQHDGLLCRRQLCMQSRRLHRLSNRQNLRWQPAKAMSLAKLFGGILSSICTGAGRTTSATRLSKTHGLASYNLLDSVSIINLAYSSTATPDRSRSVFAANAYATSRCASRNLFNASQILGIAALCKSQPPNTGLVSQNPSEQPSRPGLQNTWRAWPVPTPAQRLRLQGALTSSATAVFPSVVAAVPSPLVIQA